MMSQVAEVLHIDWSLPERTLKGFTLDVVALVEVLKIVPQDAIEVVVKGRKHEEIFFSMPKGWKPSPELADRIKLAPNQPGYITSQTHRRWRAR